MNALRLADQPPRLLDDDALQGFIRDGYVTVRSELPREFHERVYAALDPLDEGGPRGHNNLLPCVPELSFLLDEPVVRGALTSILGSGYYLHFHRHDHFKFPIQSQPLHKDGDSHSHYAVDGLRRMHRTRFAMLFYYPQDTPLETGPTSIVPRSQYVPRRALESARAGLNELNNRVRKEIQAELGESVSSPRGQELGRKRRERFHAEHPELLAGLQALDEPWEAAKIPLIGDAGTVTIVHFDMVHGRYSGNTTELTRHMVKFLFTRDREPVAPSWDGGRAAWPADADPLEPVWRSMWDWHRGAPPCRQDVDSHRLIQFLDSEDDHAALGAAYRLGTQARWLDGALDALAERFLDDDVGRRTMAAYGLVAAGEIAVPRLGELLNSGDAELDVRVIDLIGDIGPAAASVLETLVRATRHEHDNVRRYAVEALGTVAQGQALDASILAAPLADEDAVVRRNAALATARLGHEIGNGDELVPLLADNLYHWHHHVRGWSIEALQRLDSSAANRAALRHLSAARWDPMPRSGDTLPGAKAPREVAKAAAGR